MAHGDSHHNITLDTLPPDMVMRICRALPADSDRRALRRTSRAIRMAMDSHGYTRHVDIGNRGQGVSWWNTFLMRPQRMLQTMRIIGVEHPGTWVVPAWPRMCAVHCTHDHIWTVSPPTSVGTSTLEIVCMCDHAIMVAWNMFPQLETLCITNHALAHLTTPPPQRVRLEIQGSHDDEQAGVRAPVSRTGGWRHSCI